MDKESIKKSVDEYFQLEKQASEKVFTQLFLYICSLESRSSADDLYILAKLLDPDDIKKIIDYFDKNGRAVFIKASHLDSQIGGRLAKLTHPEIVRAGFLQINPKAGSP